MKYSLQKTKSDSPVRNRANYPKSAKNGEYFLKEQFSEWDTALPIPRLHFPLSSLIVAFLAVACYGNSIYGGFVFDDSEALENNKDLTSERPITSLFHHDFWGNEIATNESHKSYRPLTILTFRLVQCWGNGAEKTWVVNVIKGGYCTHSCGIHLT